MTDRPTWGKRLRSRVFANQGSFTQIFIAIGLGLVLASVVGFAVSGLGIDGAIGVLGIVGSLFGAGAAICFAYAHGHESRSGFDYVGKLIAVGTLSFSVTAISIQAPTVVVLTTIRFGWAAMVLLLSFVLVRFSVKRYRLE